MHAGQLAQRGCPRAAVSRYSPIRPAGHKGCGIQRVCAAGAIRTKDPRAWAVCLPALGVHECVLHPAQPQANRAACTGGARLPVRFACRASDIQTNTSPSYDTFTPAAQKTSLRYHASARGGLRAGPRSSLSSSEDVRSWVRKYKGPASRRCLSSIAAGWLNEYWILRSPAHWIAGHRSPRRAELRAQHWIAGYRGPRRTGLRAR